MLSLRRLRQAGKHLKNEPPKQRAIRVVLLLCLLGLVCWAFWHNTQRKLTEVIPAKNASLANRAAADETDTLSVDQLEKLSKYVDLFAKNYGANLAVKIIEGPIDEGSAVAGSADFCLILSPSHKKVFVSASPLVTAALGQQTLAYLRDAHFKDYFNDGNWPEGLARALSLVARELDERLGGQTTGDTSTK